MLGIGFTYNEQPTFSSDRFAFRTPWFYGSLYLQFLKDKSKMIKDKIYPLSFALYPISSDALSSPWSHHKASFPHAPDPRAKP